MVHPGHPGMVFQESHHLLRIFNMPLHSQRESLKSLKEKERMERCHRSPHISQKHCPDPCHKRRRSGRICEGYSVVARIRLCDLRVSSVCLPVCRPALYDHTAQRCPVPADKLCGRMYDNISPMFKRPEQVRRGKSIVHNKRDPMGMGSLCNAPDVHKVCIRVPDRLNKYRLCIIPDRRLKAPFLIRIYKCRLDPLISQRMFEKIIGTAVNVL